MCRNQESLDMYYAEWIRIKQTFDPGQTKKRLERLI